MQGNSIEVDTTAVTKWAQKVNADIAGEVKKFFTLAIKNSANAVQKREVAEAPKGMTGNLKKSISQTVTEMTATIGPNHDLDYPLFVNQGTKPHMPPIEAIEAWANAHGINPWALAKSISIKGTKANPFVKRTYDASVADVKAEFTVAVKLIAEFMTGV